MIVRGHIVMQMQEQRQDNYLIEDATKGHCMLSTLRKSLNKHLYIIPVIHNNQIEKLY